jgi:hypothetical protein
MGAERRGWEGRGKEAGEERKGYGREVKGAKTECQPAAAQRRVEVSPITYV